MTKRILVDMDGILADLLKRWLEVYNNEFHANLTKDDCTNWNFEGVVPKENLQAFFDILARPGLIRNLPVIDGAQEAIREMQALPDTEVFVLTAATAAPFTITEKIEWLGEFFPTIDARYIFTGYHKEMVKGTVLVDDASKNIHRYRREWPGALIYAIAYPHNDDPRTHREARVVQSYKNTRSAWEEIVEDLRFRFVTFPEAVR